MPCDVFEELETSVPLAACKTVKRKKYERFIETDVAPGLQNCPLRVSTLKLNSHLERFTLTSNPYISPSMFVLKTPFMNLNSSLVPRISLNAMPKKKKRSLFGKKGMCALLAEKTKVYAIANNMKHYPEEHAAARCDESIELLGEGER